MAIGIVEMLEGIDESVMDFFKRTPWGYKTYFYLSAYNRVHPTYVQQMQDKPSLSISDINDLLGKIGPGDVKLLYDKAEAEKIYSDFEKKKLDDSQDYTELKEALKGREILLVGPGKNIQLQKGNVDKYLADKKPVVISINYVPGAIDVDYVFITKTNRYCDMSDDLLEVKNKDVKIIATSNE